MCEPTSFLLFVREHAAEHSRSSPVEGKPKDLVRFDDRHLGSSQPEDQQGRVDKVREQSEEGFQDRFIRFTSGLDDIVVADHVGEESG